MPTALITGASRGLGAQIARRLAPTHRLLLGGRPSPRLDAQVAELGELSPHPVAPFAVDLTDHAAVAAAAGTIETLDVLVHCAGAGPELQPIGASTVAEWQQLLEVNLVAPAELTRLLLPALRTAGGHVVFINSGAGMRVNPGWTPYAASKFGLRALADGLRVEEPSLRVTSVFPGRIDTDMQRAIVELEGDKYRPERFLRPATVAAAVVTAIETPADAHPTEIVLRPAGR